MSLYLREWAMEVGGALTRYEGGRMTFSARHEATSGTCKVTWSNPPRGMVGGVAAPECEVRVLAGYRERGAVEVFRGIVQPGSVTYRRVGDPELGMTLTASRGELRILLSAWVDGTLSDAVDAVLDGAGLAAGYIDRATLRSYAPRRGYMVEGTPTRALRDIAASAGLEYSVESGRVDMWQASRGRPVLVDVWDVRSGLLDVSATAGAGEIQARALLHGHIRPGDRVRLDAVEHAGDVVVSSVDHVGDDSQWYTTITGRPIDG